MFLENNLLNISKDDLFDIQTKKIYIGEITLIIEKVNVYWLFLNYI